MATKKQALNACGRLKKGYRFRKGGKIIKTAKSAAKRRPKRGSQAALF
jgi:hypothetical protein